MTDYYGFSFKKTLLDFNHSHMIVYHPRARVSEMVAQHRSIEWLYGSDARQRHGAPEGVKKEIYISDEFMVTLLEGGIVLLGRNRWTWNHGYQPLIPVKGLLPEFRKETK